jgi:hypothetical protein
VQTLGKYAPMMLARCRFLAAVRQWRHQQMLLRTEDACKEAAAVAIQSYFRMWRQRRAMLAIIRGVVKVQASTSAPTHICR